MPIGDIKDYCKQYKVPLTAVSCNPLWNENKQRVAKGQVIPHPGWKHKARYEPKNVATCINGTIPNMWMLSLRHANMYVIDIDITGNKLAKDILKPDVFQDFYDKSSYVVQTGSGGLHFYFRLPDTGAEHVKNQTNIPDLEELFIDGEANNGSIDFIVDHIITEGSQYTYQDNTYKYIALKPGTSINDTSYSDFDWNRWNKILFTTAQTQPQANTLTTINTSLDIKEIQEHLDNIPNVKRDWKAWYTMAQTIFNVLGQDGYPLFINWSSKSTHHNEKDANQLWRGLHLRQEGRARTIGSILYLSRTNDDKKYNDIRRRYGALTYSIMKDEVEQNHFFIDEPKPLVVRVYESEQRIITYSINDAKQLFMAHNYVSDDEKKKQISFFNTWVKDSERRTYKRLGFFPDINNCPIDTYNTYFPPRASYLPECKRKDISIVLNHIKIMANNDEKVANYIIQGLAQILQQPAVVKGVAFFFYAQEGAGKDIFISNFGNKILGKHLYYRAGDIRNLLHKFNAEASDKVFLHCDEVMKLDKANLENLKRIITADHIRIERKGIDAESQRWFARIYATTNDNDALKVSLTDRRLMMINSSNEKRKDVKYFNEFAKFFEDDENVRSLYDYLMEVDISNYDYTTRPETDFYKEQKVASVDPVMMWIQYDEDLTDEFLKAEDILNKYNNWAERSNVRRYNPTSFGLAIKKTKDTITEAVELKKKHNVAYYKVSKEKVIEYMMKEGLIEKEE